jgi:hypothetical protein
MPPGAGWLRREMGRELARRREEAGLTQTGFAARTRRYSRSTVSHAEMGKGDVGRGFWEASDRLLGTGSFFADSYGMSRDAEPKRVAVTGDESGLRSDPAMESAAADQAFRGYKTRGWPVSRQNGVMRISTGILADALEVSRMAGMIAAGTWQEKNGTGGTARDTPRLPPCERSLAAIDAGGKWYFLVKTGYCPWPRGTGLKASPARSHIRWHSAGSTIPAPPGGAVWAHLPVAAIQLPPPHAVLDLLGWAAGMITSPVTLTIRNGVIVTPAP